MNVRVTPRRFTGTFKIPASKSHTIRQLLIASLANGESVIKYPLDSLDTQSCLNACKAFGAEIAEERSGNEIKSWRVRGNGGFKNAIKPQTIIDVGNSGTTLYLALAVAGLQSEPVVFTGDDQIKKRSAAPLLDALSALGVKSQSNNGCAPITINGKWKGGKAILPCPTSQYLSAILISAPLASAGIVTEIDVPLLNEQPYIEMTLSYLQKHGIPYKTSPDFSHFSISGGSSYKAFASSVPGDFSSAAFPSAAAAITGGPVTLLGLDPQDTQGDKFFFEILEKMGCNIQYNDDSENGVSITVSRNGILRGGTFDLNKTPDLLPAAAVTAAFAEGDTKLFNVAHARIKETDRIAVMSQELAKLGVSCTELPDGLIVHGKGALFPSKNPIIDGHGDHRIVMSFAVAALGSPIPIEITTAESVAVTYPEFIEKIIG